MTDFLLSAAIPAPEDDRYPPEFPGLDYEMDETGHLACKELSRVRREHGAEAAHAAAYALIVAAVGHYAADLGVPTAHAILQLLADNLGENVSPRPRLDS